ncbi:spermidine N1-acetyltransferase [Ferrimonas balearica]|uniref:spermidine N1-acetyltransferase n=1 Tax=Ferrimonas balearica TaxID=44012 RepID=UPI001C98EB79|nr:spermidine N1-acetyltransferase [Ferrimonas balearica]MBY5993867.1 spermidine N1-acetyltransferase [Ferrimonas balearica]
MSVAVRLRPLERDDLRFVHNLNNDRQVMAYWFEEPYEAYVELQQLYDKHIHDQSERRFIAENSEGEAIGLVELVEITHIHRRAEFQIIIDPAHQGKGYARPVMAKAVDYAFKVLNIHKLYLLVAVENTVAVRLYREFGFIEEGTLVEEFFTDGAYRDAIRMYMLQGDYLSRVAETEKS